MTIFLQDDQSATIMTMVDALRHSQNPIFRKINEVTIPRSKLQIVLTIDLRPYELLFTNIGSELEEISTAEKRVKKDCIGHDKEDCLTLWCPFVQELNRMEGRTKRSVIFIMGMYSLVP